MNTKEFENLVEEIQLASKRSIDFNAEHEANLDRYRIHSFSQPFEGIMGIKTPKRFSTADDLIEYEDHFEWH